MNSSAALARREEPPQDVRVAPAHRWLASATAAPGRLTRQRLVGAGVGFGSALTVACGA